MDTLNKKDGIDYSRLKSLTPQDRIQALYNQTPHSLSRVCLQCIDMGIETNCDANEIITDMIYAIEYFGNKAQHGDKKAIETLGRFSKHITGSGRLRFTYITKLATDKNLFDNEVRNAYEKAISSLHERPQYVRFMKDVTEDTANEIAGVIDNKDTVKDDDKY